MPVKHYSLMRKNEYNGLNTTTLCGRMDNNLKDGWNVASTPKDVTCKHCLNAMQSGWGKKLMKDNLNYK